jgi:hypothetical protein
MTRLRRLAPLAVFAAGIAALPALAQKAPTGAPAVDIGGRSVKLVVADGHCPLERSQPNDRTAIELVERLIAGNNQLHLTTADCKTLADWRAGRKPQLDEYTQVQTQIARQGVDLAGQEKEVITGNCAAVRAQGGPITDQASGMIKERLAKAQQQALIQNVALLGALDEDENGCYVGLVIKGQTMDGKPKTQLCVFSIAVLNGRLFYLYRYSDKYGESEVSRLLGERKAATKAHVLANGGHGKKG